MRLVRDERGVTLTELMAAMIIALIVIGAAVTTFVEFLDVSTRSDNQNRAQDAARSAMERLSAQVRNAMATGSTGATPIEALTDWNLVFLAPLPGATTNATTNPRGLYHVRYCLSNLNTKADVVWYQTKAYNSSTQPNPPSTTNCPDAAWGAQTVVTEHVVNRSEPVRPPATTPPALFTAKKDANNITTHVFVRAIVDWNPNKLPKPTELFTNISMRNVNRVPTATMNCQGLANGHIVCDASASVDYDGQTLSYSWKRDGVALNGQAAARLDHSPNAAKSVHTIVVTVTDPGGAQATSTKTVNMP